MNTTDLKETLRLYCRSWGRHKIYFGLESSRMWLKEIGKIFPAACCSLAVDWPATEGLPLLSVKMNSESLFYRFPHNYRKENLRGLRNELFLDSRVLLKEHLFALLNNQILAAKHVIVSFPRIAATENLSVNSLIDKLDLFLGSLPYSYRYGLYITNREYFVPAFFDCLANRATSFVISDRNGLPPLLDQAQSPFVFTTDSVIVLTDVSDSPLWRLGMACIVRRCLAERRKLFCYFDDNGDPDLYRQILSLMEIMNADLAGLSPIKQQAA